MAVKIPAGLIKKYGMKVVDIGFVYLTGNARESAKNSVTPKEREQVERLVKLLKPKLDQSFDEKMSTEEGRNEFFESEDFVFLKTKLSRKATRVLSGNLDISKYDKKFPISKISVMLKHELNSLSEKYHVGAFIHKNGESNE